MSDKGELHGVAIAEGGGDGCWKTYCPACSWAAGEWVTVCTQPLVARTWPPETVLRPVPGAPLAALTRVADLCDAADQQHDYVTADVDTDTVRLAILDRKEEAATDVLRAEVRAFLALAMSEPW